MTDPMDPAGDGGYDVDDTLAVTRRQLSDAHDQAARAIAQTLHAQRTITALRKRCQDLQDALEALEGPPDGPDAPGVREPFPTPPGAGPSPVATEALHATG